MFNTLIKLRRELARSETQGRQGGSSVSQVLQGGRCRWFKPRIKWLFRWRRTKPLAWAWSAQSLTRVSINRGLQMICASGCISLRQC